MTDAFRDKVSAAPGLMAQLTKLYLKRGVYRYISEEHL